MPRPGRSVMINKIIKTISPVIGLALVAAIAFAESPEKKDSDLKVYPILATAMDTPSFVVEYTNHEGKKMYLPEMLKKEIIILDGQEYTRKVLVFEGVAFLEPGAEWKHTVDLNAFLFNSERQKYSPTLGRWRWQSPLNSGKHSLIVKFAGKESQPIEFQWDNSIPFLYK